MLPGRHRLHSLGAEQIAEILHRPSKCDRDCRVVVVRKNISVEKGEATVKISARKVVLRANQRCDQENVIEQLKNGVNAMWMPVDNLQSNWADRVMSPLAWNLRAWFALLGP